MAKLGALGQARLRLHPTHLIALEALDDRSGSDLVVPLGGPKPATHRGGRHIGAAQNVRLGR
jgi:hypothetical protein